LPDLFRSRIHLKNVSTTDGETVGIVVTAYDGATYYQRWMTNLPLDGGEEAVQYNFIQPGHLPDGATEDMVFGMRVSIWDKAGLVIDVYTMQLHVELAPDYLDAKSGIIDVVAITATLEEIAAPPEYIDADTLDISVVALDAEIIDATSPPEYIDATTETITVEALPASLIGTGPQEDYLDADTGIVYVVAEAAYIFDPALGFATLAEVIRSDSRITMSTYLVSDLGTVTRWAVSECPGAS